MKKRIGFTLFETQIVRTFIISNKFKFFNELSKDFDIILFTDKENLEVLNTYAKNYKAPNSLKVIEVYSKNTSFIAKILQLFFRYSEPSLASRIMLERRVIDNCLGLWGYLARRILRLLLPKINFLVPFMRKIYLKFSKIEISLSELERINVHGLDMLFTTSLSNFTQDVPISIYFSKNNVKTYGTVRSWDNLVSHGVLPFVTDVFLPHSEQMQIACSKNQKITSKIIQIQTPCYSSELNEYIPNDNRNMDSKDYLVFACMGSRSNPDELNFLHWLLDVWNIHKIKIHLVILQHPAFVHDINLNQEYVSLKTFDYHSTTLGDYFTFLSEAKIVFGGGTSVLLDACYVKAKVLVVGFEIASQPYWISALRYLDSREHTLSLLNLSNIPVVTDKNSLLDYLSDEKVFLAYQDLDYENFSKIAGRGHNNLASILKQASVIPAAKI